MKEAPKEVKISKRIEKLRMERGLLQKDLADILNLSASSISNYEKNRYWPDLNTICKLADYFNVTTDYLIGRTEYICPPEILEKYVTKDYVVNDIINTLLTLDTNYVNSAVNFVNYLKYLNDQVKEKPKAASSGNDRKTAAPTRHSHKTAENNSKNGGA